MKKRISIMAILLLSLFLVGCGIVKMSSFTNINKDGSGDFKFQVLYDNVVARLVGRDFINADEMKKLGFETSKYVKDNNNVEEVSIKFNNLNDVNKLLADKRYATISVNEAKGVTENQVTINLSVNSSLVDDAINQTGGTSAYDATLINYVKNVEITNQITVPGRIVSSNATDKSGDNTAIWKYKLGQIDQNTKITLTYTTDGIVKKNYILPITIGVILAISIIAALIYKRKIAK
ncbi:hypothetical protein [Clostridium sp. 'White wine YQ']|uniref:hypothetical protein n=1 Tax=Clostridium sp. 'White wine YQ' TaxID=3027474 RepID=UPI002365A244|nr:hypothetical protein [Clostridium sp. 'White wine YQ']MDD7793875.1 hypothetical protein [Clostridium sp. 'White wine YQ']